MHGAGVLSWPRSPRALMAVTALPCPGSHVPPVSQQLHAKSTLQMLPPNQPSCRYLVESSFWGWAESMVHRCDALV